MGVAFVGPSEYAITSMGDKITSKKIAMEAGVNTIPGMIFDESSDKLDSCHLFDAICVCTFTLHHRLL